VASAALAAAVTLTSIATAAPSAAKQAVKIMTREPAGIHSFGVPALENESVDGRLREVRVARVP
jgi:hypothetical protein